MWLHYCTCNCLYWYICAVVSTTASRLCPSTVLVGLRDSVSGLDRHPCPLHKHQLCQHQGAAENMSAIDSMWDVLLSRVLRSHSNKNDNWQLGIWNWSKITPTEKKVDGRMCRKHSVCVWTHATDMRLCLAEQPTLCIWRCCRLLGVDGEFAEHLKCEKLQMARQRWRVTHVLARLAGWAGIETTCWIWWGCFYCSWRRRNELSIRCWLTTRRGRSVKLADSADVLLYSDPSSHKKTARRKVLSVNAWQTNPGMNLSVKAELDYRF